MLLWLCVAVRIVANPCSNALQKLLTVRGVAPLAIITLTHAGLSVVVAPWLATQRLPSGHEFWSYSLLAAALAIAGNWLIVEAVARSDLSVLGPINSYKPVVSLIPGMLLLGERPGGLDLLGIGLVLAGSWLLLGKSERTHDALARLANDRGVQLRFMALVLSAGEAVFLKRALLVSSPGVAFSWWAVLGFLLALPLGFRPLMRAWMSRDSTAVGLGWWRPTALIATTGLMQYCTLVTFRHLPVGVALALFQLSTLLSVVLGYAVFREAHFRRRLAGATVMAGGAILLIWK
ncbi:MAG TPA: DMT family transporter [Verrucomicrobiota bacterium]|nr:DMT family transporter [Verrucomicrobiota bacterium]